MLMLREFHIDARARRAHVNIDVVNVRDARTSTSEATTSSHHTCIFEFIRIYSSIHINGYLSTVSCCPSGTAIVFVRRVLQHSLLPGLVNY
jgi:hypothetical protein